MTSDSIPSRWLYLKPTIVDPRSYCGRAAREKICSDLGYELDVGVPPVVLIDRRDSGDHERHACVSMRVYPQQEDLEATEAWASRSSFLSEAIRRHLPHAASRAWAFNLWVGQTDHRDASPANIQWGWNPANSRRGFVFLDYAMSLGFKGTWQHDGYATFWEIPFPAFLGRFIDRECLEEAVSRIERLPDSLVESVVGRIPDRFMPRVERELVKKGLMTRRDILRDKIFSSGDPNDADVHASLS